MDRTVHVYCGFIISATKLSCLLNQPASFTAWLVRTFNRYSWQVSICKVMIGNDTVTSPIRGVRIQTRSATALCALSSHQFGCTSVSSRSGLSAALLSCAPVSGLSLSTKWNTVRQNITIWLHRHLSRLSLCHCPTLSHWQDSIHLPLLPR